MKTQVGYNTVSCSFQWCAMLNDRRWLGLFWRRWKSGFSPPQWFFFDSIDSHTPCLNSCKFLASTIFCTEDALNEESVYMLPSSLVECYLVLILFISHAFTLWHTWVYISLYNPFTYLLCGLESCNIFNSSFYSSILLNIFRHTPYHVKGSFSWTLCIGSIYQHSQGRQNPCAQTACQHPIM